LYHMEAAEGDKKSTFKPLFLFSTADDEKAFAGLTKKGDLKKMWSDKSS